MGFMKNIGIAVGVALTGFAVFYFLGRADGMIFSGGILLGGLIVPPFSQFGNKRGSWIDEETGEIATLFIGNVAYKASESDIRSLFSKHGEVKAVRLVSDKRSGRPKGYGFVEMSEKGAEAAINALNNTDFAGRELKVGIANERKPQSG